jgi:hypothetical protein
MATAAVEAQSIRVRDAILLPYKRRIASWIIRSDIWQAAVKPGAKNDAGRGDAQKSAEDGIAELDAQVFSLGDIIFPADLKSKVLDVELAKMKEKYGAIRETLVSIAGAKA